VGWKRAIALYVQKTMLTYTFKVWDQPGLPAPGGFREILPKLPISGL
jgi:hypothetical protein